jgi:hypothetical protein
LLNTGIGVVGSRAAGDFALAGDGTVSPPGGALRTTDIFLAIPIVGPIVLRFAAVSSSELVRGGCGRLIATACSSGSKAGGLWRPSAFGGIGGADMIGVSFLQWGSLNREVACIATASWMYTPVSSWMSSSSSLSSLSSLISKLTKDSASEAGVCGRDVSLHRSELVEHAEELLVVLGA